MSELDRTDAELAEMVARIAETTQPDVIICVTESGELATAAGKPGGGSA